MDMTPEKRREIGIALGAVGLFIAVLLGIGLQFDSGGLTEQGALALVGSIVLFILLMGGVGFWLANQY